MKQPIVAALAVLTSAGWVTLGALPGAAAEHVRLNYRGFSRTVPVDALVVLADTGETSGVLEGLLRQAGREPEKLRSLLISPLSADPILLDQTLNSLPGEWMLDQLGGSIHTGTDGANRQALRAALVLSASDDEQITLLEVLQNYPTAEVVLEGDRIESAYNTLATFLEPLSIFL